MRCSKLIGSRALPNAVIKHCRCLPSQWVYLYWTGSVALTAFHASNAPTSFSSSGNEANVMAEKKVQSRARSPAEMEVRAAPSSHPLTVQPSAEPQGKLSYYSSKHDSYPHRLHSGRFGHRFQCLTVDLSNVSDWRMPADGVSNSHREVSCLRLVWLPRRRANRHD